MDSKDGGFWISGQVCTKLCWLVVMPMPSAMLGVDGGGMMDGGDGAILQNENENEKK